MFMGTHTVATVQPQESQVALPGTIVNYTCHGIEHIELKFNGTIIAQANSAGDMYLNSLGINFEYIDQYPERCTYHISINASTKNNGTYFVCEDEDDPPTPTPEVYLYTVDGKGQLAHHKKFLYHL